MGPWKLAALVLVGAALSEGGRRTLRKVTKEVIRVGYKAVDQGSILYADARDQFSDLVEEIKSERDSEDEEPIKVKNGRKKTAAAE